MLNSTTGSTTSHRAAWRPGLLLLCVALVAVPCAAVEDGTAIAVETVSKTDVLQALLQRLDGRADEYRRHSPQFGCVETISWSGRGGGASTAFEAGDERFDYVVEHGDGDAFGDHRTRADGGPGDTPPPHVTPDDFHVPRYLGSAYGWIFTFRESRWPRHTYEIVGEESILGRKVARLAFRPVLPIEPGVNDWNGTAWVDIESGQLLKVQAYTPDDRARLERMERHAAGAETEPATYDVERITTWFDTRRDDLRFPSRVEIRRINYHLQQGTKHWEIRPEPVLQVDQTYRDCEFVEGVRAE